MTAVEIAHIAYKEYMLIIASPANVADEVILLAKLHLSLLYLYYLDWTFVLMLLFYNLAIFFTATRAHCRCFRPYFNTLKTKLVPARKCSNRHRII
jgi:hypothetical protein